MPQPITIKNFKQGIAETPAVGFGIIRAEIKRDGYLRPNRSIDNMKNDLTNRLKYFTQDPITGTVFGIDGDGNVWRKQSGSWGAIGNVNVTQAEGNGLGIYKDYIIKCRRNKIDVAAISSASTWTDDWATLNAQAYSSIDHPTLWSENDKFYIGDGRYVHYIDAGATFVPGSDSMVSNALDLPADYIIKGLTELGVYLLVLAEQPNAGRVAIFPWNKTASSFNQPIFINENEAHSIKVHLNTVYVLAGTSLYSTNLTTAQKVFDFDFLQNETDFTEIPAFGTEAMAFDGADLLIGVGNNTFSSVSPVGLYSLEDGGLSLKTGLSTGSDGSDGGSVIVTSVIVTNDGDIIYGWEDNQTWGIDKISEERDSSYNSYLISPIYSVSDALSPTAYTTIQVQFNTRLTIGDGFRISYRESIADSWTLITTNTVTDGDFDYTAIGGVSSIHFPATIPNTPTVQFKVELKKNVNIKQITIS